ncbi:hypothetical protein 2200_scaffold2352_00015 [Bacteriophage sp.]|nr:hypothetical protein 2200_scaffold2352_00015 [Bacteriophage sp.]
MVVSLCIVFIFCLCRRRSACLFLRQLLHLLCSLVFLYHITFIILIQVYKMHK